MSIRRAQSVLQRPHDRRFASLLVLLVAALASMATSVVGNPTPVAVERHEEILLGGSAVESRDYLVTFRRGAQPEDFRVVVTAHDPGNGDSPVELRVRSTAERDLLTADQWRPSPVRHRFDTVGCARRGCEVGLRIQLRSRAVEAGAEQPRAFTAALGIAISGAVYVTEGEIPTMVSIGTTDQELAILPTSFVWTVGLAVGVGVLLAWILMAVLGWHGRVPRVVAMRHTVAVASLLVVLAGVALGSLGPGSWDRQFGVIAAIWLALFGLIVVAVSRRAPPGAITVGLFAIVVAFGSAGLGFVRLGTMASGWSTALVGLTIGLLLGVALLGVRRLGPPLPELRPAHPLSILVMTSVVGAGTVATFAAAVGLRVHEAMSGAVMFGIPAAVVAMTGWDWWRTGRSAMCRAAALLMIPFTFGANLFLRIEGGFLLDPSRMTMPYPESFLAVALTMILVAIAASNRKPDAGPGSWKQLRWPSLAPDRPERWMGPP